MLRPLAVRLTMAFLCVGVVGALLVAFIASQRTRLEFDRFVALGRGNPAVADLLLGYYVRNNSWQGVEGWLNSDPTLGILRRRIALAGGDGKLVYSVQPEQKGRAAQELELGAAVPIVSEGRTVGTAFVRYRAPSPDRPPPFSPEAFFLRSVSQSTLLAALIAALLALALGILLSRALTRPLRALTAATEDMSAGRLGRQVPVYGRDEIGKLASSFNRMSRELARSESTRLQMTADIAHDLRTPLTVLRGYTEGLRAGTVQADGQLYETLFREVELLQHLVEDLRTLSLADAGELVLNRRSVDPKALLERAGLAHVVAAQKRGIQLRVEAFDTLPSIDVDLERMAQVLNNLVTNSLHYTSEGRIVLSADSRGGYVNLRVSDSGKGISGDDLPGIFERFFKVDRSRRRSDDARSGLGLAIAKAIVEAHGGTITADSTLGEGSQFTVRLPAS